MTALLAAVERPGGTDAEPFATIISALKKRSRVLVLTAGDRDGVLYERC
jgi:hypothetical protein